VLHELGHAAAMQMVGIPVQGIYLIPFLGGAAVPKTA
jgi:Zn-dependent protease